MYSQSGPSLLTTRTIIVLQTLSIKKCDTKLMKKFYCAKLNKFYNNGISSSCVSTLLSNHANLAYKLHGTNKVFKLFFIKYVNDCIYYYCLFDR